MLLFGLTASTARAASPACADRIAVDAAPGDALELREAIHRGMLSSAEAPTCDEARVRLTRTDGGFRVMLELESQRVERDVTTVASAATWVEAWLVPRIGKIPEGAEASPSAESGPRAASGAGNHDSASARSQRRSSTGDPIERDKLSAPAPVSAAGRARLAAFGSLGVGDDASEWAGAEFDARVRFARSVWLGAALGVEEDVGLTGPAVEPPLTKRRAFSASARGGGVWQATKKLDVALGIGAGVTTGTATRNYNGQEDDIDQGGVFGEALGDVSFDVGSGIVLLGGFAFRYRLLAPHDNEDPLDARFPAVMPAFTGELRLGAGFSLGGER